jgi:hypothetical protein
LFAKNGVLKKNQEVPQFNQGINPNNTINLDNFSQSFRPCNPPLHHAFVNFQSDYHFTTLLNASTNPTHGTTGTRLANAIATTPKSIKIKRKISLVFMPIIETFDKNHKVTIDAMDQCQHKLASN